MIKLTYQKIRNINFLNGLVKLSAHSKFSPKTSYNVARILDKTRSFENQCAMEWNKTLKKFAKKDSQGNVIFDDNKKIVFEEGIEEQKAAELKEVEALDVEINRHKVSIEELDGVGLIPDEIAALEPILDLGEESI